jgi:hypothetical protein
MHGVDLVASVRYNNFLGRDFDVAYSFRFLKPRLLQPRERIPCYSLVSFNSRTFDVSCTAKALLLSRNWLHVERPSSLESQRRILLFWLFYDTKTLSHHLPSPCKRTLAILDDFATVLTQRFSFLATCLLCHSMPTRSTKKPKVIFNEVPRGIVLLA